MKYEYECKELRSMGFKSPKKSCTLTITPGLLEQLEEVKNETNLSRSLLVEVAILRLLKSYEAKRAHDIANGDIKPNADESKRKPKGRAPKENNCGKCFYTYYGDYCPDCAGETNV